MFSKKTTAVTATKSSNKKSLFVGNKKVSIIIFIGVLLYILLIVGAATMFWAYNNYKKEQNKNSVATDEWVPTEYDDMTTAQIGVKLYNDTGKGPDEISKDTPDKNLLPTFKKAYSAAQAMYYLGNFTKSIEIYKFADTFKSKDKTYVFYIDFAGALQADNNVEEFRAQITAAKNALKADGSLSEDTKKTISDDLQKKADRYVESEKQ